MLINKTKKSKKVNLFALTALLGLGSLVTAVAVTSSIQTNNSKISNDLTTNNGKSIDNVVNYSMYSKITFVAPASPFGVKFSGSTIVSIKTNHLFGTVAKPTPILNGYQLNGWRIQGGAVVSNSTPITSDVTIEPIMEPIGTNLSINGRSTIYDGIVLNQEGQLLENGEDGYIYDLVSSTPIYSMYWFSLEETGAANALEITQDSSTKTRFYIRPKFTQTRIETQIHAVMKASQGGDILSEADLPIVVEPPYYCKDTVTWDTTNTLDLGKVYWSVYTGDADFEDGTWLCAPSEEMCYQDDTTADETIQYYGFYNGADVIDDISMNRMDDTSPADEIKDELTDVYPGAEIDVINDYFLAEIDNYNPILHGGIKDILLIGDGFMSDCFDFDQDISALFTTTVNPITIGNFFLGGCANFTNGGEDFLMPKASMIGKGFMDSCSSLVGEIEINPITQFIGANFMNDCTYVTTLIVPATSELFYFGDNIMVNCDSLETISFMTEDVSYLYDYQIDPDQRGSFTVDNNAAAAFTTGVAINSGSPTSVRAEISALYPESVDFPPYRHLTNRPA